MPTIDSSLDAFIHRQNIINFAGRLTTEGDPDAQQMLRQLLLEKERRFGICAEALDLLDGFIPRQAELIEKQCSIVSKLREDGHNTDLAEALLSSFVKTHELFTAYRGQLAYSLACGPLG